MKLREHLGNRLQFQTRTVSMSTNYMESISSNIPKHKFHNIGDKETKTISNKSYYNQ